MGSAEREWARCKHWIVAAVPYCYGTHTIEDIESGIASGQFQFWPGERCALITEVLEYPRVKALNFFLVGGSRKELVDRMEPMIVTWARTIGCTRVAQAGRRGWARVLQPKGYRPVLTMMLKEI